MIVVCGEALIDMAPCSCEMEQGYIPRLGGSPYNVAIALGRLGVPVAFLSRLSQDFFGRIMWDHLVANGVDVSYLGRGREPSTLAFVSLTDGHEAQYAFWTENSADRNLVPTDLPSDFEEKVVALHFGSLSMVLEPIATTLELLMRREQGRRVICMDPNVRPTLIPDMKAHRARLESWLPVIDVVKVSQEDLACLYPQDSLDGLAHRWLTMGPRLVVVTLGAKGSVGFTSHENVLVDGSPVTVTDTIGAGDAFSAALLAWLHWTGNLQRELVANLASNDLTRLLSYANNVSALTCTRAGADPPYLAQVPTT